MTAHDIKVAGFDYCSMSTGAAARAQQAQHVNGASHAAEQPSVFTDEELPPKLRTAEQAHAHRALQRAFLSWERALQNAAAGDHLEVLQNALRELFPVAELAAAVQDVHEWAVDYGNIYVLDPDAVQRIIVEATETKSSPIKAVNRLRPLDLKEFFKLSIKTREMLLDPILPEKGLAMLYAARGTGKTHVALGIVYAVATGTKFLKWSASRPRRVLLIDGEMPAIALQERLASIVAAAPEADFDPSNIKILSGDLIEAGGIGNLASSDVQANWINGYKTLICWCSTISQA